MENTLVIIGASITWYEKQLVQYEKSPKTTKQKMIKILRFLNSSQTIGPVAPNSPSPLSVCVVSIVWALRYITINNKISYISF